MSDAEELRECPECGRDKPLASFERSEGQPHDTCFRCRTVGVSVVTPHSFSTKSRSKGKPRKPNPAWERGIPTDNRGMPWLKPDLSPMGQKEFSASRHLIEEQKRRNHQAPAPRPAS